MDSQDRPRGPGAPVPEGQAGDDEARARGRDRGLRHVRRVSNWTAVALVAASAVTAGYFARAQANAPHASAVTATQSHAPSAGSGQPCVTAPVAVSGGSGVTTQVPAQTCAPGPGGGTLPRVLYVAPHENERD